jgi:prolyl-tRNA synthetase
MKDLYTFDSTEANALETYDAVQVAYRGFFDDLAMPYLMAGADSGNMGGNYSHEYHLASPKGEDTVISCTSCDHSINEELYRESVDPEDVGAEFRVVYSQTKGETEVKTTWVKSAVADSTEPVRSKTLVTIYIPPYVTQLNSHALKDLLPELDTAVQLSDQLPKDFEDEAPPAEITIRDPRVDESVVLKELGPFPVRRDIRNSSFGLSQAKSGEKCPKCTSGTLQLNQAIEVGHTFHLGTRYSKPLAAKVLNAENKEVDIAMGCHGVGVSRLMGAAASLNADGKGLNWPVMIAPFTVIIMSAGKVSADDVSSVYDEISKHRFELDVDAIIDDREKPLGWRLKDADLVGYPFIIVLGKSWAQNKKVEIQCRALGLRENVTLQDLTEFIGLHCDRLRNHAVERKQG